ncbi:MAG: hypothetical protein M1819_002575 [Sarea resinae]|nr:MAG: hypothetical protein M1819_002575 [Sarea resinae]
MAEDAPIVSHGRGGMQTLLALSPDEIMSCAPSRRPRQYRARLHRVSNLIHPRAQQYPVSYAQLLHLFHSIKPVSAVPKAPADISSSISYTDGEIVREGPQGQSSDGAFSTGRGGEGNIGSPHLTATKPRGDAEIIPETAVRTSEGHENYHTGRGGEGNIHLEKDKPSHDGLADKLKRKLFGFRRHSKSGSTSSASVPASAPETSTTS